MIATEEFLSLLEDKDLVAPEIVEHLRRRVAQDRRISAALIAKWLVDRGHLSRLLAQRLLTRAEEAAQSAAPAPHESQFRWEKQAEEEEEELGLAPLDDEIPSVSATAKRKKKPTPAPPAPKPPQKKPPPPAAPSDDLILLDDEVDQVAAPVRPAPARTAPLDRLVDGTSPGPSTTPEPAPLVLGGRKGRGLFGLGRRRTRVGRKRNVWDSPLLLIGGGALLLLLIVGAVLLWRLRQMGAEELMKLADEDYRAGSYTQAIAKYDDYLERFPDDEAAGMARVRRGLALMRQATDHTSDWPKALSVAKDVLQEQKIAKEDAFATEARPELVAMLPKIAEGLAERAKADLDPALVQQAEEALGLIGKYIPSSSRPAAKLDEIEALLALTTREIARGDELETAIATMNKLTAEGNTPEAYRVRAALLKKYRTLIDDPRLMEAVRAASQAELSGVTFVEGRQSAQSKEPPVSAPASVVLARRTARTAPPGAEGRVIYVLAGGAAYGLDAASGEILWRRPAGSAANGRNPSYPPTPISERAGSDAIMVDADRDEVLRIEATTGRHRWRHAVGERFDAHPVVAADRLLLATRTGRLVWIDLETGDSPGYVQLPQELRVAPTVDSGRANVYQVAEHSNLFVLSLADGKPRQVVYLGHEPGSVTVPPVVVSRYVVVADNNGVDYATLRVLALEAREPDQPPVRLVQSVRVKGHVDVAPQVSGARILIATDSGALYVFAVKGSDPKKPLNLEAETTAAGQGSLEGLQGLVRFPLFVRGQVWIADSQLTRYTLNPADRRLQPRGIENPRTATLQPLVAVGQTVFHVRHKPGVPGVLVSAIGPDESAPLWEIHLAAPLATEPIIDPQTGRITVVTSIGAIYHVDAGGADGENTMVDQPTLALKLPEIRGPVADVIQLDDGLLAMTVGQGARELPIFDPQQKRQFRRLFLPSPLGNSPIAFAGGLLAPCRVGQAFLLDPRSGDERTEPFQPTLENGVPVAWSKPRLLSENEVLLSEGRSGLYRLGIKDQPKPDLAALARADLTQPITSPIAVVGQVAYAVDASESLVTFGLPDLTPGQAEPLGAASAWGPGRVGDHVLLATTDDRLYCLDANRKILWQVPLPYGPLAGAPLAVDDGYVLAAASGVIWRVEPETGNELAKVEVGCPLGTGPVPLGDGLLVGGHDGCLYKVQKP